MHDSINLKEQEENSVLMYHFLTVQGSSCNSMVILVSPES